MAREKAQADEVRKCLEKAKEERQGLYAENDDKFLAKAWVRQLHDVEYQHAVRGRQHGKPCERGFGI
jgi:hypothetical protein